MSELAGYGFSYNPMPDKPQGRPTQLFAWQVCLLHPERRALEDAGNYADYAINKDRVTQTLGLGMSDGKNAFELDGQTFVVAVSVQSQDGVRVINEQHPCYREVSLLVAEELLRGEDHGMVAKLPNGNLVPFTPQTPAESL